MRSGHLGGSAVSLIPSLFCFQKRTGPREDVVESEASLVTIRRASLAITSWQDVVRRACAILQRLPPSSHLLLCVGARHGCGVMEFLAIGTLTSSQSREGDLIDKEEVQLDRIDHENGHVRLEPEARRHRTSLAEPPTLLTPLQASPTVLHSAAQQSSPARVTSALPSAYTFRTPYPVR